MRLLLSSPGDAFTNMALDEALAQTADTTPTFRVYYWSTPSISIGYFQGALEVLNSLIGRGTVQRAPTLVRRPTGGTAVLHDSQPSFSLVLRMRADVRQGYHLLGQVIKEALRTLDIEARLWDEKGSVNSFFCTSNFSPYDVISQGQKVAGYSARRLQGVTLFQGYLHLPEPAEGGRLVEAIITGMEKITGVRLMEGNLTEAETVLTRELRQKKYLQQDWNYKR
ncbi:MAG TPA: lipoate--protein ligase family protein [Candidatus Tripitaka sp. YC43]